MAGKAVKIYRWILISVILQVLILVFINNVYLSGRKSDTATATIIESTGETLPEPDKSVYLKLPENASNVRVSYDASYVSYILDGKLEIMDVKSQNVIKSISRSKDILTYYKWLPDRNIVLFSSKAPSSESGRVQVITYDVESQNQHEYPEIRSNMPRGSEIVDIDLSTLTNVIYVKVKLSDSQSRLYRYNIMSELTYIMDTGINTVIKEPKYSDRLVYEENGKILLYDALKFTRSPVQFKNRTVLLGISSEDNEDKVYAGELGEDNKVHKIYFNKLDDKFTQDPEGSWQQIALDSPIAPESLIVHGGQVYQISDGLILNLKDKSKMSYTGNYIDMLDTYIVTAVNNELKMAVRKVK